MNPSRRHFLRSAALAAALPAMAGLPIVARAQSVPASRWMSRIPDTKTLTEITIPGTHDSGARFGFATWYRCQNRSIAEQLNFGVRYLDVRICLDGGANGTFQIYHGNGYQQQSFTDVLTTARDFLAANPSEVVMMCLMQENSKESDPVMGAAYQRHIAPHRSIVVDDGRNYAIDRLRGKIVIVSRCLGIPGISYPSNPVQDKYSIATAWQWDSEKWPAVKQFLADARAAPATDNRLWINTTSSTGVFLPPYEAAERMRPALASFFRDTTNVPPMAGVRYGVILLDYARDDIVSQIVALNFGE